MSRARRMRGVGLVELMVGLVIGMLAIIVVMQVFMQSEGMKRTTTGADDALNSGAIALSMLQRDVRQAGYGTSALALLGCNLALPSGGTVTSIGPATINHASIPAGDANTDTLLLIYGSAAGSPDGDAVVTQPNTTTYAVATPTSFRVGDRIIAVDNATATTRPKPLPCALTLEPVVTVTSSPSSPHVTVATGVAGMTNGMLFNLGPSPRLQAYAVRGGDLTVCDYLINDCGDAASVDDRTVWVPTGSNIVSLRAEYGVDTTPAPMDGIVDAYERVTPADECGWARVSSLRVALVARSGQMEKTDVTVAAPMRAASASTAIDLSARADWQRFRYRLFETTVPLRNLAWQGVQPGC